MATRNYNSPLSDSDRDNIVLLKDKGLSASEIADILGFSKSVVFITVSVWQMVQQGYYDTARKRAMESNNTKVYLWACARAGVDLEAINKKKDPPPKEDPTPRRDDGQAPGKDKADTTPASLSDIEDAIHVASAKICDRIDLRAAEIVKALGQLSTVIQSMTNGQIKQENINTDLLLQEIKKQTEIMQGIKSNTRPRYDNRVT